MDMNNVNIEEIVKQVLSGMTGVCVVQMHMNLKEIHLA